MALISFRNGEPDRRTLNQAEAAYPEGGANGEPITTDIRKLPPVEESFFQTLPRYHQMKQIQAMYTNGVGPPDTAEFERRVQFALTDKNHARLTYEIMHGRLRARVATYVAYKGMTEQEQQEFISIVPNNDGWEQCRYQGTCGWTKRSEEAPSIQKR